MRTKWNPIMRPYWYQGDRFYVGYFAGHSTGTDLQKQDMKALNQPEVKSFTFYF